MPTPATLRRALDELRWLDEVDEFELSWPEPPSMEMSKEGHAYCAVRTQATPTPSGRAPCLVREFDIRPYRRASQGPTTISVVAPADAPKEGRLQLRVHERDLRRCRGD
eukprot:CAMPEP_0115310030 /NCGR_PEP_ID=MMETSP0270-20121206/74575_1 /TAXON_ID=71861 /ORGANISM="Scrippsiella trochoidea, Strain CCMP3099" /LENGTH=108 /DNA_ID=CAMNT_0002728749 /DNA_START=57 /DNA_END=380 /DNA_ORIENTATION=+